MNWIWNQKMQKPAFFLGSVAVCVAELTILNVCMLLAVAIYGARSTDWYQMAYTQELNNDMLFAEKSAAVFAVLGVSILFVVVFGIVTILLFRKNQLERMKTETGIYLFSGYEAESVKGMLNMDFLMDLAVAFPFVLLASGVVLAKITQVQEFQLMLSKLSEVPIVYVLILVMCLAGVFIIGEKYCSYWLKKYINRGLVNMMN